MFKRSIIALITMLSTGVLFAQAYKWTDEDGVVHYSDRPQEGAEVVTLPSDPVQPQRDNAPASAMLGRPRASDAANDVQAFQYETLEIVSPAHEETLWNIEGNLDVTLRLSPTLRPGHRMHVYLDGMPRLVNTTSFQIPEVWRGSHTLQVEIVDESGATLIRSAGTEFYVQQTSIAN